MEPDDSKHKLLLDAIGVELHGLSRADLNGKIGKCVGVVEGGAGTACMSSSSSSSLYMGPLSTMPSCVSLRGKSGTVGV